MAFPIVYIPPSPKMPELFVNMFRPLPTTVAEAAGQADIIIGDIVVMNAALGAIAFAAELATLGQVESVTTLLNNQLQVSGALKIAENLNTLPVELGLQVWLQRSWNSYYQARIPDARALANLYTRGYLSYDTFIGSMAENGYPDWAACLLASTEERAPDTGSLLELLRRKAITKDSFYQWCQKGAMHTWAIPLVEQLRWNLPGYQDMISIYMREGYLEEKWVEIPEEFMGYMEQLGYGSEWAKRLWGKHWVLPGVNLLYDMFHKKIIDYDTMTLMLRYHDFEPVWRQRLVDNAYNMIPRVDLRRAYRYKMLAREDLQERYEWLGFKPSDAEIMSGIAERTSLDRYYTRLETVARAAFRKGKLTEGAFKSVLERINTPSAAVSIMLEAETMAREAAVLEPAEEPRSLTASQICSLFKEGLFPRDVALTRLTGLGYTTTDSELLLSLSEPRPEPMEVNRDLISAASALYREGLMGPDTFKGYLRKAGLSEDDISRKIDAEDLRYRLDYAKDLTAMAKEAFKKDVYTAEELESYLLASGMQRERAAALVALEQLRKLPKPKVSG